MSKLIINYVFTRIGTVLVSLPSSTKIDKILKLNENIKQYSRVEKKTKMVNIN